MQINPFNIPVADKEAARQRSLEHTTALSGQLAWYGQFDVGRAHRELMSIERMLAAQEPKRRALDGELARLQSAKQEADEQARPRLDPRSWLSSERSVARRRADELGGRIAQLKREIGVLEAPRTASGEDVLALAAHLRTDLETYRRFDPLGARGELTMRQQEQAILEKEVTELRSRKLALDTALAAPVQALEACHARLRTLERDLRKAEAYDSALGRANSASRRPIHERCERELGDGKPQRVIQRLKREIEPIRRDIVKHDKRIEETVRNAQLVVHEVIIDGSNMTYHGGEFIGLRALEALVPVLASRAAVTINFDPGFGRKASMSSKDIRDRLPGARVHFVPSGMAADAFVLDFVEGKPHAYVISNDNFRDHAEKEAVRANRILKHAVLNDRVSIPALGIAADLA